MSDITNRDILLKEYELHRKELMMRTDHGIKLLIYAFVVSMIAFGYGFKDDKGVIFMFTIWMFVAYIACVLNSIIGVVLSSTYIKDLEIRLRVIDYERCVSSFALWKKPSYVNYINAIFLLPVTLFFIYSTKLAIDYIDACRLGMMSIVGYLFCLMPSMLIIVMVYLFCKAVKRTSDLTFKREYEDDSDSL